jgi:uncharacterized repeat protein (TIGR03803 family)
MLLAAGFGVLPLFLTVPAGAQSYTLSTVTTFSVGNSFFTDPGLTLDGGNHLLYGLEEIGNGSVFTIDPTNDSFSTLASFSGTDNAIPMGGVAFDPAGNLYGTTYEGGVADVGILYKIAAGTSTITTAVDFSGTDLSSPFTALAIDGSGDVFGSAQQGGSDGAGEVFELPSGSSAVNDVASFDGTDGNLVGTSLAVDAKGDLFGTTILGGADNDGTVWEIAAGTNTIDVLASFDGADGNRGGAGLTIDGDGDLFGTTSQGGASNDGTVFEVKAGSGVITTLASFDGADGKSPHDTVVLGGGSVYGTTDIGGADNDGTVFEVKAGSGVITTLDTFDGANGANPTAALTFAGHDLFGTTEAGGSNGNGIVFKLTPNAPEPGTLALALGAGLFVLQFFARRCCVARAGYDSRVAAPATL